MRLVEDSPTLSRWANVSIPIYFSVYIFNVTNPAEFMAGEKPIVREVGPFVFIQKRRKIIQNMDADSVRFNRHTCTDREDFDVTNLFCGAFPIPIQILALPELMRTTLRLDQVPNASVAVG